MRQVYPVQPVLKDQSALKALLEQREQSALPALLALLALWEQPVLPALLEQLVLWVLPVLLEQPVLLVLPVLLDLTIRHMQRRALKRLPRPRKFLLRFPHRLQLPPLRLRIISLQYPRDYISCRILPIAQIP